MDHQYLASGWIDRWMDGLMDGWIDGWMDGWMDRLIQSSLIQLSIH